MSKRAVIYARVSTERQEDLGYSLAAQIEGCRNYAARNSFEIVLEIKDSVSGTVPFPERPGGRKVFELVDARSVDAVILYTHDRTARDDRVMEYLLFKDHLSSGGVELHYSDTGLDPNTMEGNLVGYIKSHAAAEERRKIKQRMHQGRLGKAQAGKWIGNIVPFGYRKVGMGRNSSLEIDEDHSLLVKRIFDMYLGNGGYQPMPLKRIAMLLTHEGIPSPRGGVWGTSTISLILNCESYTGVFHYKDIQIPLPHLQIIDTEIFLETRKRRRKNGNIASRNAKYEYLLRGGYFRCTCGRSMIGMSGFKGEFLYYRCCGRARRYANQCLEKSWASGKIEGIVWEWLSGLLADEQNLEYGIRRMVERRDTELVPKRNRLASIENHLAQTEEQIHRLVSALYETDNAVVADAINVQLKRAGTQQEALAEERTRLTAEILQGEMSEEEIAVIINYGAILREELQVPDFQTKRYLIDRLGFHAQLGHDKAGYYLEVSCRLNANPEYVAIESSVSCSCDSRAAHRKTGRAGQAPRPGRTSG